MQEIGCSGFARHVIDAVSILILVLSKIFLQKQFSSYYLKLSQPPFLNVS